MISEKDVREVLSKPLPPRICVVKGCGRPHKAKGYCSAHDQQIRRTGKITPVRPYGVRTVCKVCGKPEYARGLCNTCYQRDRRSNVRRSQ